MAIYHLSTQIISRKAGRNAVASAAYRAGEKLLEEKSDKIKDYSHKGGVVHSEIFLPDNAPAEYSDRGTLWNAVEEAEKRKDSQLSREFNIAFPNELNKEQNIELMRGFIKEQFVARGMIADFNYHTAITVPDIELHTATTTPVSDFINPHADEVEGDKDYKPDNDHGHVMLTLRDVDENGFGGKNRSWNDRALMDQWRKAWADHANAALEKAGFDERIDHRSLKDQGSDLEPTIHLGPASSALEEKGVKTEKGDHNRAVGKHNAEILSLGETQAEIRELQDIKKLETEFDRRFSNEKINSGAENEVVNVTKEAFKAKLVEQMFINKVTFTDLKYIDNGKGYISFKNGGVLMVMPNQLRALGMSSEDAADKIVTGGLAKGWKTMNFTGSDEFYELAVNKALDAGISVSAKNDHHQRILDSISDQRNGIKQAIEHKKAVNDTPIYKDNKVEKPKLSIVKNDMPNNNNNNKEVAENERRQPNINDRRFRKPRIVQFKRGKAPYRANSLSDLSKFSMDKLKARSKMLLQSNEPDHVEHERSEHDRRLRRDVSRELILENLSDELAIEKSDLYTLSQDITASTNKINDLKKSPPNKVEIPTEGTPEHKKISAKAYKDVLPATLHASGLDAQRALKQAQQKYDNSNILLKIVRKTELKKAHAEKEKRRAEIAKFRPKINATIKSEMVKIKASNNTVEAMHCNELARLDKQHSELLNQEKIKQKAVTDLATKISEKTDELKLDKPKPK